MTNEIPLQPKEEKTITWHGREFQAAITEFPIPFISVNSFCRAFGFDETVQRRRLGRRGWFAKYLETITLATAGGPQATVCLRIDALPSFMVGVDLSLIEDGEVRQDFEAFQDEAASVLAEHFGLSEIGELRFLRETIGRMTVEQAVDEEAQETGMSERDRLDRLEEAMQAIRDDYEERLEKMRELYAALRDQIREQGELVKPKERLTPEMQHEIRERVNHLAALRIQVDRVANPYGEIWGRIKYQWRVGTYKDLPQAEYPKVIAWLEAEIAAAHERVERGEADDD